MTVRDRASASPLRTVRRWLASAVLGLVLLATWGALFSGGMRAVVAFTLLVSLVPVLGIFNLLFEIARLAMARRFTRPIALGASLSALALWPAGWNFGWGMIAFPSRLETASPTATVRLPSDAALRVAWGGDTLAENQHRAFPDQVWAYDLFVEPYLLDSPELAAYGCWNTPVLSPIDARVHAAEDGRPDARPGELSTREPLGNHVVLALPTGTFLVIAHLKQGSVRVRAGDRVHAGDVIGACGNSGHTSEPHIHIHHQRQDPTRHPVGFAEGLPLFFRDHDGERMPRGGLTLRDGRVTATGAVVKHRGRDPH